MKLTTDQKKFLRKSLLKISLYRETYTEFYDHILSALEAKPDTMDFRAAVESIIADDFGGYGGMRTIETRYQKTIMREMQRKYLGYIIDCLKFPLVIITAALAVLFYWVTQQAWFNLSAFFLVIIYMRLVPGLLQGARYLWLGYIFKSIKRSVKTGAFKWLDFLPIAVCMVVVIIPALTTASPSAWFKNASPITLTLCMLLCALHTLIYYRVYKSEFKTSISR